MLASLAALAIAAAPGDLLTTAEKTGFAQTGRYDEVERLCAAYLRAYAGKARCFEFGRTPEGRPMLALAASAAGALDAAAARGRPVVLFQGGIHAGEIDGKDAGFWALREWLELGESGPLARATAVFIPVLNPDGHERFGRHNRPNQVGPEEMGWRVTAQDLNLNRDYAKADAPETRALLRLLAEWDPIVYADLHVTDGAKFQPDLAVLLEPLFAGDEGLRREGRALRDALFGRLEKAGHSPLAFYPSFVVDGDPRSGFAAGVAPPRFSQGYWALRNRFGILVETHSWKGYRARVAAMRDTLRALLDLAAKDGERWLAAAREADAGAARLGGSDIPLDFQHTDRATSLAFPGYHFERVASAVSGALALRYDEARPEVWQVPLYGEAAATASARVPRGGYLVPAAWAELVGERLRIHGIAFETLSGGRRGAEVEAWRAVEASFAPTSFQGRQRVSAKGAWAAERLDVPAGSLYVAAAQPAARLVVHLLDPAGPDSLLAWGFFNAAFEKKEYMEDYVAEEFGSRLLAADRAVRAEFEARLADPAFARDPAARLEFFHRHHPSWDWRYRLYPVFRAERAP